MKKTQVGGQAVMEGVMMRGAKGIATAVRTPKGDINIEFQNKAPITKRNKILALPIIRGFVSLIDSLMIGIGALNFSASFFEEEGETSKFEQWFLEKFKDKGEKIILVITLIISLSLSVGLFFLLPTAITSLFKGLGLGFIWLNIIEAIIRVGLFVLYVYLIAKLEDIERLFQYHGAEHKTIFCYENEEDLTVENVKKYSRLHPRCGTNFLFLVMIVSILVFSFTGWNSVWQRFLARILLLPLVSGITYEIIKWMGRSENKCARLFAMPGLKLQLLTTREPDDSQIEVAIASLKAAEGILETIDSLLKLGSKQLKEAQIESYLLDSQLLLAKTINKDKLYILTHREETVTKIQEKNYLKLIKLRKEKMPIKYILEECEFMGINLYIKPGVLIPRPDTEVLVEEVLDKLPKEQELKICDMCCGSGAIGIALSSIRKDIKVHCVDISDTAGEVTKRNISRLGLKDRVSFIKSDLFAALPEEKDYDAIVSNPPYIKKEVIPTLMEDVREYEPHLALDGGRDGLDFYRSITKESIKRLKPGAILAFEIGFDQEQEVCEILESHGFTGVKCYKDLAGNSRVVLGFMI